MNSEWTRLTPDTLPSEGIDVMVSDGEIITKARYVLSDNHRNWLFAEPAYKDISLLYWAPYPALPPKIRVTEPIKETVVFES